MDSVCSLPTRPYFFLKTVSFCFLFKQIISCLTFVTIHNCISIFALLFFAIFFITNQFVIIGLYKMYCMWVAGIEDFISFVFNFYCMCIFCISYFYLVGTKQNRFTFLLCFNQGFQQSSRYESCPQFKKFSHQKIQKIFRSNLIPKISTTLKRCRMIFMFFFINYNIYFVTILFISSASLFTHRKNPKLFLIPKFVESSKHFVDFAPVTKMIVMISEIFNDF